MQPSPTPTEINVLSVIFDAEIAPAEIPAFRGAVATHVGHERVLFHNHLSNSEFRYAYPLIQYKRLGRKAAFVGLGEGVNEMHHFFSQRDWSLSLNGRAVDMRVERLHLEAWPLRIGEQPFRYRLQHWLALNEKNYAAYRTTSPAGRPAFLERLLTGNILAFAKGIGWQINQPITVRLLHLPAPFAVRHKGVPVLAFSPTFETNVALPPHIGLGKAPSHGFGTVLRTGEILA